jgi:hypothetical protein
MDGALSGLLSTLFKPTKEPVMSPRNALPSPPFDPAALAGHRAAAGSWKLAAGRALSLRPRQRSVLEIAQGRAWVTLGEGARGWPSTARSAGGDRVLVAGERLAIEPGMHVVVEAWTAPGAQPHGADALAFRWDVAPVTCALVEGRPECSAAAAEWDCAVVQPLRDLGRALAQGGRAVADSMAAGGRLAWGFARFARHRIAMPPQCRAV